MKTEKEYKELTIKEFTKAADVYESGHAGIYELCKEDYPYIAGELAKENYQDLLDNGSLAAAREKGIVGMEGKEYIVKDGDVILFRFNV